MPKYYEPPEAGVGGPEPITPVHPPDPRDDKDVTEGVKDAFFLDPDLAESQFEVETRNHIVILRGKVGSDAERRRAVQVALGVEGVEDVRDEITVAGRRLR